MGTPLIVTVAAAGMARQVFREFLCRKKRHVFRDRSRLSLKDSQPRAVKFVQRPAADAADHDGIHPMAAQPGHRVAGPMLMDPIAVVDSR